MSAFLQRRPLAEAREVLLAGVTPVATELVRAGDAAGRTAATDVLARHPAPHYRASAMDGIAVRACDTWAAADGPVLLRALASPHSLPAPGDPCCAPIDTGSALPAWADAVIRSEQTSVVAAGAEQGEESYRIQTVVAPGHDVRRAGEDIDAGTLVVPAGSRIRPWDIGAMLATGTTEVEVRRRPRVAILATGSEVVEAETGASAGQVIDSNSHVVASLVEQWGASAHRLGIVADDEQRLADAITDAAARFDVVCVIAGSSAGRKDFSASVLASLGELLVHGVDIAPGRPVALARIRPGSGNGAATPAIALPGYPVAAIVACNELLGPLVAALLAAPAAARATLRARAVRKIPSRLGVEDFRRVCITRQPDGSCIVAPLASGAGSISTVTGAHGWLRIGPTVEGVDANTDVEVELLVSQQDIDAAFVLAGQPGEPSLALEHELRRTDLRARVVHLRRGLRDALDAVAQGEAHAAILEEPVESGTDGAVTPPLVLRTRTIGGIAITFAVVEGSAADKRLW